MKLDISLLVEVVMALAAKETLSLLAISLHLSSQTHLFNPADLNSETVKIRVTMHDVYFM